VDNDLPTYRIDIIAENDKVYVLFYQKKGQSVRG